MVGTPAVRKRPLSRAPCPGGDAAADCHAGSGRSRARHSLEEMAILPTSVTPTVRELPFRGQFAPGSAIHEANLPELGSRQKNTCWVRRRFPGSSGGCAHPGLPHPPPGFSRETFDGVAGAHRVLRYAFSGRGEPARLGVPPPAWILNTHSLGWTAFPRNEVLVSESGPTPSACRWVVSLSGLETLDRPLRKAPSRLRRSPPRPRSRWPSQSSRLPPMREVSHQLQACAGGYGASSGVPRAPPSALENQRLRSWRSGRAAWLRYWNLRPPGPSPIGTSNPPRRPGCWAPLR